MLRLILIFSNRENALRFHIGKGVLLAVQIHKRGQTKLLSGFRGRPGEVVTWYQVYEKCGGWIGAPFRGGNKGGGWGIILDFNFFS